MFLRKTAPRKKRFSLLLVIRLWFIAFLAAVLTAFIIITKIPEAAEFFAVNFSQHFIRLISSATGLLPVSFYEILVAAAIISVFYIVIALIVNLVRKNWRRLVNIITRAAAAVLLLIVLYNLSAGFAYYRGAPEFCLPDYEVSEEMADEAMTGYINELYTLAVQFSNSEGVVVCPYTLDELCEKIINEYARAGDWFYDFTPRVKYMTFSTVMSYLGFSGVFFGPSGEVNINILYEGTYYMPLVIAHEIAHAKGVMREADAEMTARYILISSSDPYLRYAGLMNSFTLLFNAIQNHPDRDALYAACPSGLIFEWIYIRELEEKYQNPLQVLFDKINSWFINSNNQTGGSDEYNPDIGDVVVIPPDPDAPPPEPGEPPPPPVYQVIYSETQKMIVKLYFL